MSRHLKAHKVAKTQSIDEMRAALFDIYDARAFDLSGNGARFSAVAAYCNLGASSLSYCAHESPVRIEFRDDDYVRFQVCIAGSGRTSFGEHSVEVTSGNIVCSPADAIMEFGASLEQFSVRVDRAALEHDLSALLGSQPKDRLVFAPSVDLQSGAARRLRDSVMHTVSSIDVADIATPAPLLAEMDRTLRLNALYGMPHNFSELLNAPVKDAAPWQVLRIEQWIDAHWRQDITIEILADISGVSGRSIFASFKKARGYTPMAYLKKARLDAANRMLRMASPGATVTGIGLACGFANLGHFAHDYLKHFGERPSTTLAGARRIAA